MYGSIDIYLFLPGPSLKLPAEEMFREISIHKRNRSKRPRKTIYLMPVNRKINQIKDDKLRYAYRLAEVSGLRVSELADLEPQNFTFKENLQPVEFDSCHFIGFNAAASCNKEKRPETGVHFYLDDYQFQRLWNRPDYYLPML